MRTRIAVVAVLIALGVAGCSTKYMANPVGDRSGIDQLLITRSADTAIEALDLKQFAGQRVAVQSAALVDACAQYVKQGLTQRLVSDGAIIVPEAQAEVIVVGKVQAAGADKYGGGFNPITLITGILWRSSYATGQVQLEVFAYRVGEPSQLVVMNQKARNTYREFSVFVFGPFKSTSMEDWK